MRLLNLGFSPDRGPNFPNIGFCDLIFRFAGKIIIIRRRGSGPESARSSQLE